MKTSSTLILDVNTVADAVIFKLTVDEKSKRNLSNLKLQKLLYYIQAWSLGINKKPLFKETFQAWVHGPVCPAIYHRFIDSKMLYSLITAKDIKNLENINKLKDYHHEFIDYILENYSRFSGAELERMTHSETPWIEARGDLKPHEKCRNEITKEAMKIYYGKKWDELNKEI